MTEQNSRPTGLASQSAAFKVLSQLSVLHPDLPAAFIAVHAAFGVPALKAEFPATIRVQLDVRDFEPWRARLGIDPATVALVTPPALSILCADTVVQGVPVHIAGHLSVALTAEQIEAPRVVETAEVPA